MAMLIKIYCYHGGKPKEVATGLVDLSYPPRITECKAASGYDVRMLDEVKDHVELLLKNDLLPGNRGLKGTLAHYKPPVRESIVQISGVDYAWTIEEAPVEAIEEKIEESPKGKTHHEKDKAGEKKKKILVVDDEEDIVRGLKIRLRGNGYDVVSASDPIQGISMVRKEEPDLIILDIRMPAGGGFNLAERLKLFTDTRTIPIIILTGSSETAHELKAKELGIRYYMRKPYDPKKLLDVVEKALKTEPSKP
jgi:CheY-like chemotaxis protein